MQQNRPSSELFPDVVPTENEYESMRQNSRSSELSADSPTYCQRASRSSELSADASPYLQRAESPAAFPNICRLCQAEIFSEERKYINMCVYCRPFEAKKNSYFQRVRIGSVEFFCSCIHCTMGALGNCKTCRCGKCTPDKPCV